MIDKIKTIYQKAIDKWGERSQLEMAQEEATELALAVRRFIIDPHYDNYLNLAE